MSLRQVSATGQCQQQKASLYARKLNNSAAFCIEVGEYNRAIVSLRRALKIISSLHRQQANTAAIDASACLCCNCAIESCISYSEAIPSSLLGGTTMKESRSSSIASTDRCKKRRLSPSKSTSDHSLFQKHPWRQDQALDQPSVLGPKGVVENKSIENPNPNQNCE